MNAKRILGAIAFTCAFCTGANAQIADSLHNFGSLYPRDGDATFIGNRTAQRKGDILTIVVTENAAASLSSTTAASKTDTNTVGATTLPLTNWLNIGLLGAALGGGSSSGSSSNSGTGSIVNNQSVTATITVVVKDVLPNGNLLVEGQRWVTVHNESQNLLITGLVRRDDIAADNSIPSSKVANAEIKVTGKGLIADRQRRGLITRVLDWLF